MEIETDIRFKEFVLIAGKFSVVCNIFCVIFHKESYLIGLQGSG
ncbi:hypothetical protein SPPR111872_00080 [Sphingobacterium prati]